MNRWVALVMGAALSLSVSGCMGSPNINDPLAMGDKVEAALGDEVDNKYGLYRMVMISAGRLMVDESGNVNLGPQDQGVRPGEGSVTWTYWFINYEDDIAQVTVTPGESIQVKPLDRIPVQFEWVQGARLNYAPYIDASEALEELRPRADHTWAMHMFLPEGESQVMWLFEDDERAWVEAGTRDKRTGIQVW